MKRQSEQENDSGQSQDNKEKPSSRGSKPKRTEQRKDLDSQTSQSQSTNGSILETQNPTHTLESEQPSGLKTTRQRKPKSLMPVPKHLESRTLQALKRIKVKPESLLEAPPLTPMLKTTVKGGLKAALDAMRFATDDTEIRAFLKVYDKVPIGDRECLSWEAMSIAAKVNVKHLLGAIQLAVQTHCWNRSRFIAVSNHPDVTKSRVKYAKMAGGEKDRTALDIALGIMQSPKGPTFIGTQQVAVFRGGGQGKAKDEDDGKTIDAEYSSNSDDGFDSLFPSPNEIQEKLVPIRQRLLEG